MKPILTILLYFFISNPAFCQAADGYNLGIGLYIFKYNMPPNFDKKPLLLYKDSLFTNLTTQLIPENTDCPTCMLCAEPTTFYKGPIHTFVCNGYDGMALVCNKKTAIGYELFIDTTSQKAYTAFNSKGKFYTWNAYMQLKSKQGDYFSINRQWDSTVLYDKPYPLNKLPAYDKRFFVNLTYSNLNDLQFYPVKVSGYWLKLKVTKNGRFVGYCWFIWRTEREWTKGFAFRN